MSENITFDLDGDMYADMSNNSDNPVDVSEPEEIEDVGCISGACTL